MNSVGFKKNHSGMTLVELIVAVAIFVAAIVPMLYAFVYSTGYNFRAQQTMQSTGIAQAVIERAKAANADYNVITGLLSNGNILKDGTNFSVGNPSGAAPDFWYNTVTASHNVEDAAAGYTNRRAYDVHVNISPITGGIYDISSIQSMSYDSTATFSDSETDLLLTQDEIAIDKLAEKIENEVIVNSNVTISPAGGTIPEPASYFSASDVLFERIVIDRKFTIVADDSGVNIRIDYYTVGYDTDFDGTGEDITLSPKQVIRGGTTYTLTCSGTFINDYSIGSGAPFYTAEFDADGGDYKIFDGKATAIYVYFYPGYRSRGTGIPGYRDMFKLDNNMTTSGVDQAGVATGRLNFYLFKQYKSDWDTDTSVFNNLESKYKPTVLMDGANFPTYLYDNFLIHARTGKNSDIRSSSDSFANSPASNVTLGMKCYNSSVYVTLASSYKDSICNAGGVIPFESVLLADQAVLPYKHELGMPSAYRETMFNSRYSMYVEVFKHSTIHDDTTRVERIDAEVLNW